MTGTKSDVYTSRSSSSTLVLSKTLKTHFLSVKEGTMSSVTLFLIYNFRAEDTKVATSNIFSNLISINYE